MGIFKYPYTDLHELNLDMILRMIKELDNEMDDFVAANKITNAGAWDITKQYQAWTVVSDNNTGYISLRPVPVGIDIHNIEYWGIIADYNILITDLSNRISILEADNISNKARILALENDNTSNKRRITALEDQDAIIISDSYGVTSVVGANNWANSLKAALENRLGSTVYTALYGGRGFVPFNISDESFLDSLHEFDTLTAAQKAKIKHIIVCGGANDGNQNVATIETNISDFCDYAYQTYPNAKVYIGMVGYSKNPYNIYAHSLMSYQNCTKYGALYLNGVENALRLNNLQVDGVHPNSDGNVELSNAVINAFFTGKYTVNRVKSDIVFTPSGICTATLDIGAIEEIMTNDTSIVRMYSAAPTDMIRLTVTKDTWDSKAPVEIGTLSGNMCASSAVAKGFGYITHGYMRTNAIPAIPIPTSNMMFEVHLGPDNKVYLSALGNATTGSFWGDTITNVGYLMLDDMILRSGSSYVI